MKSEIKSFTYAWKGIIYAIRSEKHMRFHLLVAFLVAVAGWFFNVNYIEWCLIITTIGAVIAAEIFNTAFEQLVNLVSPQQHVIAGKVKDLAAGAVLVISIAAIFIGLIIFIPKILTYTF